MDQATVRLMGRTRATNFEKNRLLADRWLFFPATYCGQDQEHRQSSNASVSTSRDEANVQHIRLKIVLNLTSNFRTNLLLLLFAKNEAVFFTERSTERRGSVTGL